MPAQAGIQPAAGPAVCDCPVRAAGRARRPSRRRAHRPGNVRRPPDRGRLQAGQVAEDRRVLRAARQRTPRGSASPTSARRRSGTGSSRRLSRRRRISPPPTSTRTRRAASPPAAASATTTPEASPSRARPSSRSRSTCTPPRSPRARCRSSSRTASRRTRRRRGRSCDDVIVLLMPSRTPTASTSWATGTERTKGTPFDGSSPAVALPPVRGPRQQPRLVHADPAGDAAPHARPLRGCGSPRSCTTSTRWAATGSRLFVPPFVDPMNPNVHPLIWRDDRATSAPRWPTALADARPHGRGASGDLRPVVARRQRTGARCATT